MSHSNKLGQLIDALKEAPTLEISDLKNGQIVYEFGKCVPMAKLLVISAPERVENQKGFSDGWRCMTTDSNGNTVMLFAADKGMYKPRLYDKDYSHG